ncbi:MAG: metalloregulator ArsR/SmtB family transcription factor [Roseovarius sp.]|nr:metalloregulator ArsR/SmtB family transcription factor [Roseovarius sp.]
MILPVLTALAEPTRLNAMRILSDGQEHCVCELMTKLGVTQSRMSRHMKVLTQAGLLTARRDAQWVRYRLDPKIEPRDQGGARGRARRGPRIGKGNRMTTETHDQGTPRGTL